jgi:hypothetical protein
MIFQKHIQGSVPGQDGKAGFKYKRVPILTKYSGYDEDDSSTHSRVGPLLIPTSRVFSFGVSVNTDPTSGKNNGYVVPLCLYGKDGASHDEKAFVKIFNDIVEKCKEYLLEDDTKDELEQYELKEAHLDKLNPLYYKKVKGKIDPSFGPTLYCKCISTKDNLVKTIFQDPNGTKLDYRDLIGKYCFVRGLVKFESIFVGSKISLQVKLHEAVVELLDGGMKSLLLSSDMPIRTPQEKVKSVKEVADDDGGSIKDDDDDEDEEKPPTPKQTVVKKRVVKKK